MTLLSKTFDYTCFSGAFLSPATGFEYHIVGVIFDNNTGDCFADNANVRFEKITPAFALFGVKDEGEFSFSMGALRNWELSSDNPWALIEEGKTLFLFPDSSGKRISGILYYYKVSTAEVTRRIFIS